MAFRPIVGTLAEVLTHAVAFLGTVLIASEAGLAFLPVLAVAAASFLSVVILSRSVVFWFSRSANDRARLLDAATRNVPYVSAVLIALLAWHFNRSGLVSIVIGGLAFAALSLVFWRARTPAA